MDRREYDEYPEPLKTWLEANQQGLCLSQSRDGADRQIELFLVGPGLYLTVIRTPRDGARRGMCSVCLSAGGTSNRWEDTIADLDRQIFIARRPGYAERLEDVAAAALALLDNNHGVRITPSRVHAGDSTELSVETADLDTLRTRLRALFPRTDGARPPEGVTLGMTAAELAARRGQG